MEDSLLHRIHVTGIFSIYIDIDIDIDILRTVYMYHIQVLQVVTSFAPIFATFQG